MIGLAGGTYIFENLGDTDQKRSTMNMQIEEFYAGAKDADFLIYNSSIDGGISSVKELLDKCELLADFTHQHFPAAQTSQAGIAISGFCRQS